MKGKDEYWNSIFSISSRSSSFFDGDDDTLKLSTSFGLVKGDVFQRQFAHPSNGCDSKCLYCSTRNISSKMDPFVRRTMKSEKNKTFLSNWILACDGLGDECIFRPYVFPLRFDEGSMEEEGRQ